MRALKFKHCVESIYDTFCFKGCQRTQSLIINSKEINDLKFVRHFNNIKFIHIKNNSLKNFSILDTLPKLKHVQIDKFINLRKKFNFVSNAQIKISNEMINFKGNLLKNIIYLNLEAPYLEKINNIFNLKKLDSLLLNNTKLNKIDKCIFRCKKLKYLLLSNNKYLEIKKFYPCNINFLSIFNCEKIKEIKFYKNKIEFFKSVNTGIEKLPYIGKKLKSFNIEGIKDFILTCNFCKNKYIKTLYIKKK